MNGTLRTAIERAGGFRKLARKLGISHQAILQWEDCPPLRVLAVEKFSGVSRELLRPDLYPSTFKPQGTADRPFGAP